MLSVSIILNKKMLHCYEQSWQNQIERILPKGLVLSKCKIFKMLPKMPSEKKETHLKLFSNWGKKN
jgi:hypothetical protein